MDLMKFLIQWNYWPFLILLLTINSPGRHSLYEIGNQYTDWLIQGVVLAWIYLYKSKYSNCLMKFDKNILSIYIFWLLIAVLRGCFIANGYMEQKSLVLGTLWCLPPVFILVSSSVKNVAWTLKFWLKYAMIFWLFIMIWLVKFSELYLAPVFFIACFVPLFNKCKTKYFLLILTCLIAFSEMDHRSWVIKGVVTLMVVLAFYFKDRLSEKFLKMLCFLIFFTSVLFIFLGLTGRFNIFSDLNNKYAGRYSVSSSEFNRNEDMMADTRTFIYYEVFSSALINDYWIQGRTPAKGNDSEWVLNREEYSSSFRHHNEIGFLNIFTWLGILGLILYSIFYFRASYLALYKSNNIYVKILGCVVAFRWCYGWIEDLSQINMENYTLWLFISLCLSNEFRSYSDNDVKLWIQQIIKD